MHEAPSNSAELQCSSFLKPNPTLPFDSTSLDGSLSEILVSLQVLIEAVEGSLDRYNDPMALGEDL